MDCKHECGHKTDSNKAHETCCQHCPEHHAEDCNIRNGKPAKGMCKMNCGFEATSAVNGTCCKDCNGTKNGHGNTCFYAHGLGDEEDKSACKNKCGHKTDSNKEYEACCQHCPDFHNAECNVRNGKPPKGTCKMNCGFDAVSGMNQTCCRYCDGSPHSHGNTCADEHGLRKPSKEKND